MRLLFALDLHDYEDCTHTFVRNSARSIILRHRKVAMIHSLRYDCYEFPGGGIEPGEDPVAAMIRETREEAGMVVIPESVREYGYVHRIQKSVYDETECFVQDNFYYLCDTESFAVPQELDDYEAKENYAPEFVDPRVAIEKNRNNKESSCSRVMLERETGVLEMLLAEGLFDR